MNITHPAAGEKLIEDALNADNDPDVRVIYGGDVKIKLRSRGDDVTITRHSDDRFRLNYVGTYGNTEFVHGRGCDASGFVIRDSHNLRRLEKLAERAR